MEKTSSLREILHGLRITLLDGKGKWNETTRGNTFLRILISKKVLPLAYKEVKFLGSLLPLFLSGFILKKLLLYLSFLLVIMIRNVLYKQVYLHQIPYIQSMALQPVHF